MNITKSSAEFKNRTHFQSILKITNKLSEAN